MIAESTMLVDGQWYKPGDEVWDLGSFEAVGVDGKKRNYSGFSKDVSKLPHYVSGGSTALCLDTGDLFAYHAKSDTWNLLSSGGGGTGTGTNDYRNLSNKPSINGVTLQGDKSLEDLGIVQQEDYTIIQGIL